MYVYVYSVQTLTQLWGQHSQAVALNMQLFELGQISDLFGQRDQIIVPQAQLQREKERERRRECGGREVSNEPGSYGFQSP